LPENVALLTAAARAALASSWLATATSATAVAGAMNSRRLRMCRFYASLRATSPDMKYW
jgi:hypothetical protein